MKKIVPQKVILSRDEYIRAGKCVIGYWYKDYVAGSSHFRPSSNEGHVIYFAKLNNNIFVQGWTMAELRDAIIEAGKDDLEPIES